MNFTRSDQMLYCYKNLEPLDYFLIDLNFEYKNICVCVCVKTLAVVFHSTAYPRTIKCGK